MQNYKTELTGIVLMILVSVLFRCVWQEEEVWMVLMTAIGTVFGVGVVVKAKKGMYKGQDPKQER